MGRRAGGKTCLLALMYGQARMLFWVLKHIHAIKKWWIEHGRVDNIFQLFRIGIDRCSLHLNYQTFKYIIK